tara:strand:- start:26 stop:226 length:201 start_codon:yes stop_codon:yes gene_type:complete
VQPIPVAPSIAMAAADTALAAGCKAIIVLSDSGNSARILGEIRIRIEFEFAVCVQRSLGLVAQLLW